MSKDLVGREIYVLTLLHAKQLKNHVQILGAAAAAAKFRSVSYLFFTEENKNWKKITNETIAYIFVKSLTVPVHFLLTSRNKFYYESQKCCCFPGALYKHCLKRNKIIKCKAERRTAYTFIINYNILIFLQQTGDSF